MQSAAPKSKMYSGVNLVGDLYTKIGLSEAARKLTVSLLKAGINVSYCELVHSYGIDRARPETYPEFRSLPEGYTYPINLLTHAISLAAETKPEEFESYKQGRYTIPYWFWEFQQFPPSYTRLFERVDEIWVASGFLKTAIENYTRTPVKVVPVPVDFQIPSAPNRKQFGIPEDKFVFLFSFSALSSIARKNPFAVAKAFEMAFADVKHNRPLLIIKSTYMSSFPSAMKDLQNLLHRSGGRLIDENYSRATMNELLACADTYVSLHRSEGFGLGMAEAMYLGKAVIATNYSSNTDFMKEENSYLVDYQLRAITEEDLFYQPTFKDIYAPGYFWAEPNIEHAAYLMRQAYEHADERIRKANKASKDIQNNYSYEAVGRTAQVYLSDAEQAIVRAQGINIVGDLYAEVGISEAARRLVDAIQFKNIELSYLEKIHNEWVQRSNVEGKEKYSLLKTENVHSINLVVRNIGEMPALTNEELAQLTAGKYTIAYWFWETEQLPESFISQIDRVDEIWVASRHVQKAFYNATSSIPVHVIPVPVEFEVQKRFDRKHFGLPEDSFIFFFSFSATSGISRKNPWAVIEAFSKAFTSASPHGPLIVLKVSGLDVYPQFKAELQAKLGQVEGILLEQTYSRDEMIDLLACIDVYISLHRAEGFGLGMAEAMYLGKPVIATGYSSNTDFMNEENSYVVNFTLRHIKDSDHHFDPAMKHFFKPGVMRWAEPDVDQASQYMLQLYSQPKSGLETGKKAAETIRQLYSKEAVGNLVLARLQELLAMQKPQAVQSSLSITVTTAEIESVLPVLHQTFQNWNLTRLQEINTKKLAIERIPLIGRWIRFLTRSLHLGSVWAAQAEFEKTVLVSLEAISKYLKQNSAFTHTINVGSIQDAVSPLSVKESLHENASLQITLTDLQAEIASTAATITQLQQTTDKLMAQLSNIRMPQENFSTSIDKSACMVQRIEEAVNQTSNEIDQLLNKPTSRE